MGFDLPVFIVAGIQDALGPMQLAIAGIYASMMLFLRRSPQWVLLVASGLFIGVLVAIGVMFDLGIFDPEMIMPGFLFYARWFFLVLGMLFLALGFLFLREWRVLVSGAGRAFAAFIPAPSWGIGAVLLLSLLLAGASAFLSSLWPVNYQVMVQGGMSSLPGSFVYSLGAFCVYEFFRNGAALFVLLFFVLARRGKNAGSLRRKKSLVSIIVSAACLAVGGSLCFFFFVAARKPWL